MEKIKKEDLRQISYDEFGKILDQLTQQVLISGIKFELIVPILRSGGITGMHLASKLGITNILPAQYKYEYEPVEKIIKKFEFPELDFVTPDTSNILIVDSNTVWGGIAKQVIADVKKKFPQAKIYFASVNLDQSARKMDGIEQVFWGALSNEKREMSSSEAKTAGITNDVIIFPWEDLEEQWREISTWQDKL